MAGIKCTFFDEFHVQWDLKIGTFNHFHVKLGVPAVKIRWAGDELKSIVGSEATVTVVTDEDLSFLNVANAMEYKMTLIRKDSEFFEGHIWWTGFVIPGKYSRQLQYMPTYTIVASDRLGTLTDIPYSSYKLTPTVAYEGLLDAITIIGKAIGWSGLECPIRCAVNLFEITMDMEDADDDPLKQTFIEQLCNAGSDLIPGSCYSMIEKILRAFKARIFQSDGWIWIQRVVDMGDPTIEYRQFIRDSGEPYADPAGSYVPEIVLNQSDCAVLTIATQEMLPEYRQITVIENFGKRESLFPGFSFPKYEFVSDDDPTPRHWNVSLGSEFVRRRSGDNYCMSCKSRYNQEGFANSWYLMSPEVEVNAGEVFILQLNCGFYYNSGLDTELVGNGIKMELSVNTHIGTTIYYWNGIWTDGGGANGSTRFFSSQYDVPIASSFDNLQKLEIKISALTAGGTLRLIIYDPGYYGVHGMQGTFFLDDVILLHASADDGGVTYAETKETIQLIDDDNNVNVEYILEVSNPNDYLSSLNTQAAYTGGIYVKGEKSEWWWKKGESDKIKKLADWIIDGWEDNAFPISIFRGVVRANMNYHNTLQVPWMNDMKVLPMDMEFDIAKGQWSGNAYEIKGMMIPLSNTTESKTAVELLEENSTKYKASSSSAAGGGGSSNDLKSIGALISPFDRDTVSHQVFPTNRIDWMHVGIRDPALVTETHPEYRQERAYSTFDVIGSIGRTIDEKTAISSQVILLSDYDYMVLVNAFWGPMYIQLPLSSTCNRRVYGVKAINIDANPISMLASIDSQMDMIEGADSNGELAFTEEGQTIWFQSDGEQWRIVGESVPGGCNWKRNNINHELSPRIDDDWVHVGVENPETADSEDLVNQKALSTFDIIGSFGKSIKTIFAESDTYALDDFLSVILVDSSDGPITVVLPDAATCKRRIYTIKAINVTNEITVISNGGDIEDLGSGVGITYREVNQVYSFQSDGIQWWIISFGDCLWKLEIDGNSEAHNRLHPRDINNYVGIGIEQAQSTLDVEGSNGKSIERINTDTLLDETHYFVLVDASAAPVIITLPNAMSSTRRIYGVKAVDITYEVKVVSAYGSIDNIAAGDGIIFDTKYQEYFFQSDGVQWWLIGGSSGGGECNWDRDAVDGELYPKVLTDKVGVGINTLLSTFDVEGSHGKSIVTVTDSLSLNVGHYTVLVNALSNLCVITLPNAAICKRRIYIVKAIDITYSVTVISAGGDIDDIDAAVGVEYITVGEVRGFQSDGVQWHTIYMISSNLPVKAFKTIAIDPEVSCTWDDLAVTASYYNDTLNLFSGAGMGIIADAQTKSIKFICNIAEQIQSDWNQTISSALDYIKNKPEIFGEAVKNFELVDVSMEQEIDVTTWANDFRILDIVITLKSGVAGIIKVGLTYGGQDVIVETNVDDLIANDPVSIYCGKVFPITTSETIVYFDLGSDSEVLFDINLTLIRYKS